MPNITTSPPPPPPPPPATSKGATVTIFALLGPLVGSLSLLAFMAAYSKPPGGTDSAFAGVIMAAGYLFGIVPAALTGLAVARTRSSALQIPLRGALLGALIAGLFWALAFGGLGSLISMFAAMGAVSGLVCGTVSQQWEHLNAEHAPSVARSDL
jgi:membrane associated rhomboid family serine protease